jgi:hypothetical protein
MRSPARPRESRLAVGPGHELVGHEDVPTAGDRRAGVDRAAQRRAEVGGDHDHRRDHLGGDRLVEQGGEAVAVEGGALVLEQVVQVVDHRVAPPRGLIAVGQVHPHPPLRADTDLVAVEGRGGDDEVAHLALGQGGQGHH